MIFLTSFLGIFGVVALHEGIHLVVAMILGYKPIIKKSILVPAIVYENKNNDFHNLLIAGSAPLILIFIGLLLPAENLPSVLIRLFCLLNILNLLPLTHDGEMILLSLCHLIRRRHA